MCFVINSYLSNAKYKCPYCKTPMVRGEDKQYETADEHISQCHDDRFKPTFICPHQHEESHPVMTVTSYQLFYDYTGDVYVNLSLLPESLHRFNFMPALGSSGYDYQKYLTTKEKTTVAFKLLSYKLELFFDLTYKDGEPKWQSLRLRWTLWKDGCFYKGY